VVVLTIFTFTSPASGLVVAPNTVLQDASGVGNPVPVVVIVLDELPVQTLMDADGNIDESRYPGFASLLDDFTWYRNTATVHHHTSRVLPMILTGIQGDTNLEPSTAGYPKNLFTLLGSSHDVWAHEEVTDFCGPEICREQVHPTFFERWRLLLGDTSVVAAHVLLPANTGTSLPPLDGAWTGFGNGEPVHDSEETTGTPGEAAVFDAFLDSLRTVGPHPLRFIHIMDPHSPWHALPEGLQYAGLVRTPRAGSWGDDQSVVDLAHQSHLLQTGYVDSQLGRFLDLVRGASWYEDALVMIMADHGIAFTAAQRVRGGDQHTVDDLAYVPLFVKSPGQVEGGIDDRPAMLSDVLPTIVDVLEIESVSSLEGVSLLDERPDASRVRVFEGHETLELPTNPSMGDAIERKVELFGSQQGWDGVYNFGPFRHLVGQAADLLAAQPESAEIEIVNERLYRAVDPSTGVVPALIRASVESEDVGTGTWLAVAINGTIAGTAPVHDWTSDDSVFSPIVPPTSFSVLVPATSFVVGENQIELYRIEDTGPRPILHHLEER
jgi:hypothetical protein